MKEEHPLLLAAIGHYAQRYHAWAFHWIEYEISPHWEARLRDLEKSEKSALLDIVDLINEKYERKLNGT